MRGVYDTNSFREVKADSFFGGLFRFFDRDSILDKLTVNKTIFYPF